MRGVDEWVLGMFSSTLISATDGLRVNHLGLYSPQGSAPGIKQSLKNLLAWRGFHGLDVLQHAVGILFARISDSAIN
jgi:hypothetical protein